MSYGAVWPCVKRRPTPTPITNMVAIHDEKVWRKYFQLTPDAPSHNPIPTMPPVMHCDDEVGRPYWEATMITTAVDNSAAKPLAGVSLQNSVPTAFVIVLPYVARPATREKAEITRTQMGASTVLGSLPV